MGDYKWMHRHAERVGDGDVPPRSDRAAAPPVSFLQALQGSVGNRAVGRLITTPHPLTVQRHLAGSHRFDTGVLSISGDPVSATRPGEGAYEQVSIRFTPTPPGRRGRQFDDIHFVQVARILRDDPILGGPRPDLSGLPAGWQDPLTRQMTTQNGDVEAGFFVDQLPDELARRQRGTPASPRYTGNELGSSLPGSMAPRGGTVPGRRRRDGIQAATMGDRPGGPVGRITFYTSARGGENGPWLGTMKWGFDVVLRDGLLQAVNEEQPTFTRDPGPTATAAVDKFNTYWTAHPGTG